MTSDAIQSGEIMRPDRIIQAASIRNGKSYAKVGLTAGAIAGGVTYAYGILDAIDAALLAMGEKRLAQVVELANLSSMVGNLLRSGIAKASNGVFIANGPHKYPDLLNAQDARNHVEIKMAGESKRPKGHLAKPGYHLTARYVLCDVTGCHWRGVRNAERRKAEGVLLYIWELRFGYLRTEHFTCSNTEGDSGKTANVNKEGMKQLTPIYFDGSRCPYDPNRSAHKAIADVCSSCHGA